MQELGLLALDLLLSRQLPVLMQELLPPSLPLLLLQQARRQDRPPQLRLLFDLQQRRCGPQGATACCC